MPQFLSLSALLLLTIQHTIAFPLLTSNNSHPTDNTTWDYIIVGSGAGGIPTAATLAASGARTLLIERGPPSSGRWTTPQYGGLADAAWKPSWLSTTNLTTFDVMALYTQIWSGNFSADIFCPDVAGGIASCVLGGGTAINAGLWWKPAAIDWDYVFPAGMGWSATDMQDATDSVFARIPGTSVPSADGELYLQEGAHVIEDALEMAGWTSEESNETPDQKTLRRVYANTTFMYEHGERGGPMATYLVDAVGREKFELWTNTMVERVVRDGSEATGLAISSNGVGGHSGIVKSSGKGGIILSAGAFGTPKILFRSGIGPRDQLEIVKQAEGDRMIDESEWIDLPVGYNLVDNINTDIVLTHPSIKSYDWSAAYTSPNPNDASSYLANRTGPLTQTGSNLNPMIWSPLNGSDNYYKQLQWTGRVASSLGIPDNGTIMTLSNYLGLGQWSRSRATIDSNLTMHSSAFNLSAQPADRAAIVSGLDSMRAALATNPEIGVISPSADTSSADHVDNTPHEAVNHWLGSCKMGLDDGREEGGEAVVDGDARVYGMRNLFVVDASVVPGLTTANPSALVAVVGVRAAERILGLMRKE